MRFQGCFQFLVAPSHRRDRGHVGRKFRPGLVGGDARHRGDLLSRRIDEPVDHVRVRPGAGAARAENLGLHGRRRLLHESRHADGRAADEPAEPHAFPGVEPRLWRDVERRAAQFKDQNDYAAIARGMGLERVFNFDSIDSAGAGFVAKCASHEYNSGHTFVVLEVEAFSTLSRKMEQAPDRWAGDEISLRSSYRKATNCDIFGYRL